MTERLWRCYCDSAWLVVGLYPTREQAQAVAEQMDQDCGDLRWSEDAGVLTGQRASGFATYRYRIVPVAVQSDDTDADWPDGWQEDARLDD